MKPKTIALAATAATLFACQAALAAPVLWIGDSGGQLGTVDVATGHSTVIGRMAKTMVDIAFDKTGQLWGLTIDGLYRINKDTAAISLVGNLFTDLIPGSTGYRNSLVFGPDGTLYAATGALYTINPTTGVPTLIGNAGTQYASAGDLAFIDGQLYLSSRSPEPMGDGDPYVGDKLVRLDTATGAGTDIGLIGYPGVFGLATDNNRDLYGTSDTKILKISTATGAGTFLVDYLGAFSLGQAYGSAFYEEAIFNNPVPEPSSLLLAGVGLLAFLGRRGKAAKT